MRPKRELTAKVLARIPTPLVKGLSCLMRRSGFVCLTYHRIATPDKLDEGVISCSMEEFEWQMSWLAPRLRVLSGAEIAAFARRELAVREPCIGITFDDGYADNLRAGEIMARHRIPGVFFVASGFVGTNLVPDWDRLAYAVRSVRSKHLVLPSLGELGPWKISVSPDKAESARNILRLYRAIPPHMQADFLQRVEEVTGARASDYLGDRRLSMTWDEVRRLKSLGHTVGAHTHSHPMLSSLSAGEQKAEIAKSKRTIEENLCEPVFLFAYPVGKPAAFTPVTKKLVADCGFDAAFSFYGGVNRKATVDRYDMRRVAVEREMSRSLFQARALFSWAIPI